MHIFLQKQKCQPLHNMIQNFDIRRSKYTSADIQQIFIQQGVYVSQWLQATDYALHCIFITVWVRIPSSAMGESLPHQFSKVAISINFVILHWNWPSRHLISKGTLTPLYLSTLYNRGLIVTRWWNAIGLELYDGISLFFFFKKFSAHSWFYK